MFTKDNYDDIIHLPHHVSPTRPPMPMRARAAQFTPICRGTGVWRCCTRNSASYRPGNRAIGRRESRT